MKNAILKLDFWFIISSTANLRNVGRFYKQEIMRTLIIGLGALGGVIAARLLSSGADVSLAARDANSCERLKSSGLLLPLEGIKAEVKQIGTIKDYEGQSFDLIILATKAEEAMRTIGVVGGLLGEGGILIPLQNGSVYQSIADQLGADKVIGCVSHIGATMVEPGIFEQRNSGHLLIGELGGGISDRIVAVRDWLSPPVAVQVTGNFLGASWGKLLLNCSVTTIGAIVGKTMREYCETSQGKELFRKAYDEALLVARTSGVTPEASAFDPVPPGWTDRSEAGSGYDEWLEGIIKGYGDLKPSMLQDFERGRTTEIAFINGFVRDLGKRFGVRTPTNSAIVDMVRLIESGSRKPGSENIEAISRLSSPCHGR
ncbi:2-dehydropantoate 2-reductase [Luteolibacter sp. SL250]|uniref:ketopantoate reductase family protein n=1 Tax=Luteolibacter sp. SL250 TaxID=2995170 RepID=UPI0022707E8C|nr:2-dehydropantoate 2-reductase [Luteolibacter sp. SL250]WAC21660.1 2-dehydropantoate 2-reductase [Luteolibacter sp. SL250]